MVLNKYKVQNTSSKYIFLGTWLQNNPQCTVQVIFHKCMSTWITRQIKEEKWQFQEEETTPSGITSNLALTQSSHEMWPPPHLYHNLNATHPALPRCWGCQYWRCVMPSLGCCRGRVTQFALLFAVEKKRSVWRLKMWLSLGDHFIVMLRGIWIFFF